MPVLIYGIYYVDVLAMQCKDIFGVDGGGGESKGNVGYDILKYFTF